MGAAEIARYREAVGHAIATGAHHDQRRALLTSLLDIAFGITVHDVELEKNVRVAETRGRIDLLYRRLVFEVKRNLAREHDDVVRELTLYLSRIGEGAIGLATDGLHFDAYRLSDGELTRFASLDLDASDDEAAFQWLDAFLFSQTEVNPTAADVVRRFGPTSPVFQSSEAELKAQWSTVSSHPTVQVKRDEWDRLLRMVYGTDKGSDDLFVRHTYLALVARIFAFLAIAQRAPHVDEASGILDGTAFERLGVHNLAEEDFFAWGTEEPIRDDTLRLIMALSRHLGIYSTSRIDEDLLKNLYETLVDPDDRHDLGEYYTPDWLADYLLRAADYGPGITACDPSCGSGTFLFTAIRILREAGLTGVALVSEAESHLTGFDVHPLAVTIARANFALALRGDAADAASSLSIPIWMADSLATPAQKMGRPIEVPVPPPPGTNAGTEYFLLPTEMEEIHPGSLAKAIELLADYAKLSIDESSAEDGLSTGLLELEASAFTDTWLDNLRLFRSLLEQRRDTVWESILKNAARPQMLARQPVDLLMGNPPWLAGRGITKSAYQERVTSLALHYGLLASRRGWQSGALELATVFVAFCSDYYLRSNGKIAFVLPRGVLFGAKQHESFRYLKMRIPLSPDAAFDLGEVEPLFRVPSCAVIATKRAPVRGEAWRVQKVTGRLNQRNASPAEAVEALHTGLPVPLAQANVAVSRYLDRALQGATLAPRPFWFITPQAPGRAGKRWVETDPQQARRAKPPWTGIRLDGEIEDRYFFGTLLSVYPYRHSPLKVCALPVAVVDSTLHLLKPEEVAAAGTPRFHDWLIRAEQIWGSRKKESSAQSVGLTEYLDNHANLSRQRTGGTFVMYGGKGTHVRAVVVDTTALVQSESTIPLSGFVFDMNMYYIRCDTLNEAHYLAAVLNTPFINDSISDSQTKGAFGARDIHRRPFEVTAIPDFNAEIAEHSELADISRAAHSRFTSEDPFPRTLRLQQEPIRDLIERADALVHKIVTRS
jgi:hypothetical protein